MRRLTPALALLAVTAGSLTAAADAAPKLAPCPKVDDAKGDAADPSLDITGVTYSKVGKSLDVTIAVNKLAENVSTAPGDRFEAVFTANDKKVEVYYKRSRTREEEANVFYQQGLRVDGVFVSDSGIAAKYNLDTSTVTISITLGALKAGVGKSVDGATITDLGAEALGSLVATNSSADVAESTKSFKVTACKA